MVTERKAMTKREMKEIVRLRKQSDFNTFYEKLIGLGILVKSEDGYYLDSTYFYKGKMRKLKDDGGPSHHCIEAILETRNQGGLIFDH